MISRRFVIGTGPVALLAGCMAPAVTSEEPDWRPLFADLSKGAIHVNLSTRRLAYWAPQNVAFREFPIGVPSAPELERRGRTRIVRKREGPSWAPTPSMLRRNPDLPRFVPPGPDNPLGAYALYLSWQYYAIHGTNDPRTIGRATTSGCIRLFEGHIRWLFEACDVGTPVLVT